MKTKVIKPVLLFNKKIPSKLLPHLQETSIYKFSINSSSWNTHAHEKRKKSGEKSLNQCPSVCLCIIRIRQHFGFFGERMSCYIYVVCVCECAQRYHLFFVGRIYTQTHTCLYTPKHTTKNSPIFLQRFFTNNFQIFYINFITIVYTSTKTIVLFVFYRVFVVNIHKNNKIFT